MANERAHVDPEQLSTLAENLRQYSSAISLLMEDLDLGLNRLGHTFQDETYFDFRSSYQVARQQLVEFAEETRRYWPLLEHDIEDLRAFLRRRVD